MQAHIYKALVDRKPVVLLICFKSCSAAAEPIFVKNFFKMSETLIGFPVWAREAQQESVKSSTSLPAEIPNNDDVHSRKRKHKGPAAPVTEKRKGSGFPRRTKWQAVEDVLPRSSKIIKPQNEKKNVQNNYEMLVKLDEILVSNSEPFSCPVCFGDVAKDEGVVLHECLHCFCRPCLISTVQHSETPTVKCPFINEIYKCDSELQEMEIKSLVSSKLYDKHLQRSITVAEGCAENSFHCKTPNCPGWCFYDDREIYFICDTCGHMSCRSCDVIHDGKTCKQYRDLKNLVLLPDDKKECLTKNHIDKLIKTEEAMPCPKCKAILKKEGGCDAIICAICKTAVCWATKGPRWGPKGKGDTSGGCMCDFKVKKCHPNCGYCH